MTGVRTWISSQILQLQGNWNTGRLCVLRCRDCCSCQCSHGKLTADPDYPPPPGRWWSEQHGSGSDLLHLEANVPERSQSGTRVLRIMTMQCSLITIVGHHLRAHIALLLTSLACDYCQWLGFWFRVSMSKHFPHPLSPKLSDTLRDLVSNSEKEYSRCVMIKRGAYWIKALATLKNSSWWYPWGSQEDLITKSPKIKPDDFL